MTFERLHNDSTSIAFCDQYRAATHVQTWEALRAAAGRADFLYVCRRFQAVLLHVYRQPLPSMEV